LDTIEELYRWGLIVLSPMTTFFTVGLAVMLPFSLAQTLPTEDKSVDKKERFAKILLLVFLNTVRI
jgi:hypothetical protein